LTRSIKPLSWGPAVGHYNFKPSRYFPNSMGDAARFPELVKENHCYHPTGINKRKSIALP